MKLGKSRTAVIFVRTSAETKAEFLKAVEIACSDQNTLAEFLIKKGSKNIIKRSRK